MTDVNWLLRWSAVMETHGGHVHVPTFSSALLWSETIGCWRVNTFAICSRSARTLFSWRWLAVKEWDLSLLNYSHHQLSNKNSVCDSDYYELRLCNTCLNVWVKSDESAQSLFFWCVLGFTYIEKANWYMLILVWKWYGSEKETVNICRDITGTVRNVLLLSNNHPTNQSANQPNRQTQVKT